MVGGEPFSLIEGGDEAAFLPRSHDDGAGVGGSEAASEELGGLAFNCGAVYCAIVRGRGGVRCVCEEGGEFFVVRGDDVDVCERGVGVL